MALPTGPGVTFLFTDIEGSTRLERAVGSTAVGDDRRPPRRAPPAGDRGRRRRGRQDRRRRVLRRVRRSRGSRHRGDRRPARGCGRAVAGRRGDPGPDGCSTSGEGRLREGRASPSPRTTSASTSTTPHGSPPSATAARSSCRSHSSMALGRRPGAERPRRSSSSTRACARSRTSRSPRGCHRVVVAGAADDIRRLRTHRAAVRTCRGEVDRSFVGRAAEIEVLRTLLAPSRIVTLTGPGGSGKTRLAAGGRPGRARSVSARGWFVDLAALRDPGLVEAAIASSLGLRESPERADGRRAPGHLRDRTTCSCSSTTSSSSCPRGARSCRRWSAPPRTCA